MAQIGAKGLPTGLEQGDDVGVWGDGGLYEYLLGSFGSSGSPQESSPQHSIDVFYLFQDVCKVLKKNGGSCTTNIIFKSWIQQLYRKL